MKTFPVCEVVFTDRDSLCYIILNVENVHEVMTGSKRFDFSNFPQNHPNYSTEYRMTPGKFKDECPDSMIAEAVGHRGKMYWVKKVDGGNKKAFNWVCSNVKNNVITHEDFKESLMEDVVMEHMQCRIGHTRHTLMTIDKYKKIFVCI